MGSSITSPPRSFLKSLDRVAHRYRTPVWSMSPTNVHAGAKWNVNSKTWLSPVRSSVDCHEVAASHPDRVLDRLHAGISTLVSPLFYFILSFFLSHSPVHLDRVSSASSSTPWGPISAHVHFAQQIISNVVRRGVKRERMKNKEERVAVSWNRTRVSKTTRRSGIFVDPWISIHAIFFLLFHLRSSRLSISKVREMWLLFFFAFAATSFGWSSGFVVTSP